MLGKILRYVLDYYWDTMKWDFDNIKMWGIHNVQFNFPLDMRCWWSQILGYTQHMFFEKRIENDANDLKLSGIHNRRFSDFSYFLKLIISEYSVYTINIFLELLRVDVDDLKSRVYTTVSNEPKKQTRCWWSQKVRYI